MATTVKRKGLAGASEQQTRCVHCRRMVPMAEATCRGGPPVGECECQDHNSGRQGEGHAAECAECEARQ